MPEPRLHLDADASIQALCQALLTRGHDVTRTPTAWMPLDADDEAQLLGATAQGRCIFTFNVRDFLAPRPAGLAPRKAGLALARRYPQHGGVILAAQKSWSLSALIAALDRLLTETESGDWVGQVRWLNRWREDRPRLNSRPET